MSCDAYKWCELDHTVPDEPKHIHDKHVTIEFGGLSEEILLSINNGTPRLDYVVGLSEMWREPGEPADDFLAWAGLLRTMSATYDEFVRETTATLRRHSSVTLALSERDA